VKVGSAVIELKMVFNIFAFALAWFIAAATSSLMFFAVFPSDPLPAVIFQCDWRNVPGWILGMLFGIVVYKSMRRKDKARR